MINVKEIDEMYAYDKDDLGYSFHDNTNSFKVWSPLADSISVCIYDEYNSEECAVYNMIKEDSGIWTALIKGDLKGKFYTYKVKINDSIKETVDPYAKAVSVNGEKSALINMEDTNPDGWNNHDRPKFNEAANDIIYELHTRDFSIDSNSGIKHKGKFLAFTEEDTVGPNLTKTGLSHIKDLGVTHVQLLPIYDFGSIDESGFKNISEVEDEKPYNWGYDPANYDVPEGSYSTNPFNPITRIKELKEAVKAIHEKGLGVIMDVVFNHMYDVGSSSFNKLMPGYFFRYDENGNLKDESGCGNAVASENKMVRKYIVDSVKYWAEEYKLDGFRFDLMGLLDVETMNEIRHEVDKIDPSILIIGEGWNMGQTLKDDEKAIQGNAYKLKNIGFFNDDLRDGLRGNNFIENDTGFLAGNAGKELDVKRGILGGINYSDKINLWGEVDPNQVVNYIECHDNHTLYDKLNISIKDEEILKYSHRLGTSIVLLSQGIPFIHAGQEFFRTKGGVENSYNSSDSVNKLDWKLKSKNEDTIEYIKGLIELRKEYAEFRMNSAEKIKNSISFIEAPENVVIYIIKSSNREILVVHNAQNKEIELNMNEDLMWNVVVDKHNSGVKVIREINDGKVKVSAISTIVAIKG